MPRKRSACGECAECKAKRRCTRGGTAPRGTVEGADGAVVNHERTRSAPERYIPAETLRDKATGSRRALATHEPFTLTGATLLEALQNIRQGDIVISRPRRERCVR